MALKSPCATAYGSLLQKWNFICFCSKRKQKCLQIRKFLRIFAAIIHYIKNNNLKYTEMKKEEEKKKDEKKISNEDLENVNGGGKIIIW